MAPGWCREKTHSLWGDGRILHRRAMSRRLLCPGPSDDVPLSVATGAASFPGLLSYGRWLMAQLAMDVVTWYRLVDVKRLGWKCDRGPYQ